jgi:hypothetical protein
MQRKNDDQTDFAITKRIIGTDLTKKISLSVLKKAMSKADRFKRNVLRRKFFKAFLSFFGLLVIFFSFISVIVWFFYPSFFDFVLALL